MTGPAFLFPGQGSQYVGMGKDFCDAYPAVGRLFDEASDLLGKDLRALCFTGPESVLVQTDNVQPAITLVNRACFEVLREEGISPSAAAGHSLGEYSALCAAGVLSFADAMKLVQLRGMAMKEAAERHPGGMLAVFGLGAEAVSEIAGELRGTGSVEVANFNSPSQVILTGDKPTLELASALAKKRGAKLLVPLKVSGPWHSKFMTEARDALHEALAACPMSPPGIPVISNVTAEPHPADPERIRTALAAQMVSPVRWSSSMDRLVERGHELFLEAGPGGS